MKKAIRVILLYVLLLFPFYLSGQDAAIGMDKIHTLSLQTQYSQFKDQFNYGLVYRGINLGGDYSCVSTSANKMLCYNAGLIFGLNFNKGTGVALRIKPVDFFYGSRLPASPVTIGGFIAANYQWQLYPDLQSGHMFWLTTMEIGPRVMVQVPLISKIMKVSCSNSVAGLTSRPEPVTETYFYTLKLSDFIGNSHHKMKFGSLNRFIHTNLVIEFTGNTLKKFSVAYAFEYFGYFQDPELHIINHSIYLKWKVGKL